jgi:thiazole/oxazole-forming peptide maturase SagD family component
MNMDFQPLVTLFSYQTKKNELRFIGRNGTIILNGSSAMLKRILKLCTGLMTVEEIAKKLPSIPPTEIAELLEVCRVNGIVCDSRETYSIFHSDSANPMKFSHAINSDILCEIAKSARVSPYKGKVVALPKAEKSMLGKLLSRRKSVSQFEGGKISGAMLSGLLQATYSMVTQTHWSTPSSGALYPLDIYLVILNEEQVISKGVYRWNPEKKHLILHSKKNPGLWVSKTFNAKELFDGAGCIVCIGANLKRTASKYSNRAYRYALIEAGHAAQNAYLFAADSGLAVVEYGGFNDELLKRELGMNLPEELLLTSLIVGFEKKHDCKKTSDQKLVEQEIQLREKLVGPGKPIENVSFWEPEIDGVFMAKWAGSAIYSPPYKNTTAKMRKRCVSFATGNTQSEAVLKSIAEGYERFSLELYRSERFEAASRLEQPFLDPRVVTPYEAKQYKVLRGLIPFNPNLKVHWVEGRRLRDQSLIWVPSDLVFYENRLSANKHAQCYLSNSSGVAAHFDKQIAIQTGLRELIERDAFSLTWYCKRKVFAIPHADLSDDLRDRMNQWKRLGYKVTLLDLTVDGPSVVLAMISASNKKPALFSGASCRDEINEAANRAFDEAEFMGMTWQGRMDGGLKADQVYSPDDHGRFYINPKRLAHANWLIEAPERSPRKTLTLNPYQYDPIVVDITPKPNLSDLKVVRVLSPLLLPINFGWGSEHCGHKRMGVVGLCAEEKYPAIPHFFA